MNAKELEKKLVGFYGTQNYYRHFTGLLYTDGIKAMAETAQAYWLIDLIASYQIYPHVRAENFQLWEIKAEDNEGKVEMRRDTGEPAIIKQELPYTDFPEGNFKVWVVDSILLLPSEY